MFLQKNYAAAVPQLQRFLNAARQDDRSMEAEYMLACTAYELQTKNHVRQMELYLEKYPESPYENRIYALMASAYFFKEDYNKALAMFNSCDLESLSDEERDDMTYRKGVSYLSIGNTDEAAAWFETLRLTGDKYETDCTYYIAYIRYTQGRYDEALEEFGKIENAPKYRSLVPYYIADCYLKKKQYDMAEQVALKNLSTHPGIAQAAEMHRILGESYYYRGRYRESSENLAKYMADAENPQRASQYMLGMSYYKTGVFTKAASALGEVVHVNDALTQNAYLHLGLSYLQSAEKNKARMAFEQAASLNTDPVLKERAAYNYALCIHETSFSAFGESVTAFERFLNEFPNSAYRDKVSGYLVDVYMNTRSYEAALQSIERITKPGTRIMVAKQKILFHLGTQAFTNASFLKAIEYFNKSIELRQYDKQTNADAHFWRGESFYRINRQQEAGRDFSEYLRQNTQTNTNMYALAHYNSGYTAFHRKEYAKAREWFQKYVRLEKTGNPETLSDAYNRIGDCYLQVRNFGEAKSYYSHAERMNTPSGDYSYYQQALVAGLQKDYSEKITLLNRLAEKYPSSPYLANAIYEKGRSYVLMENNSQAISVFNGLMQQFPNSPLSRKAAAEIGLLYYQSGSYEQAVNAYKYVVEAYPGSEEARLALRDLKSLYTDLNRVDEFATLASSLPGNIRFDVTEQDSLTYVAAERIYGRGQTDEAKASFTKYLQSFPEGAFSLNTHYYLMNIAKTQREPDQILYHSGKVLEYPDSPFAEQALISQGEVQFNKSLFNEALATYKQLKEKASNADRRQLALTGILRSAQQLQDGSQTIQTASDLLSGIKITPELRNEALFYRAKAYIRQNSPQAAMNDLRELAKDTRTVYGAEAKFLVAQQLYETGKHKEAEKELLDFIDKSTPHAYWLARGFILLSDVYLAMENQLDARQYLLSLQQNYKENDEINGMIESRLQKLNN